MLVNVQILRAVAAYLVVLVHLRDLLPTSWATRFVHDIGYSGVDLFFVISGFIMVYTTSRRAISPSQFFLNRLRRVAPLYYAATLFVFGLAASFPSLFGSTSADAAALVKSLAFVPFEKSEGRIYPIYYLGWTLNYEIFFYAVFALSIKINHQLRSVVCAVIIVLPVIVGQLSTSYENILLYVYSRPIMLDFVLGMLIAAYHHQMSAVVRQAPVLPWLALGLGAIGLVVLSSVLPDDRSLYEPPTNTFVAFGMPAALIVAAAVALDSAGVRPKRWTFLQPIGDASYSIYLSHFFVVGAAVAFANRLDLGPAARVILGLSTLLATAAVGICLYRSFERPVGAILARWTSPAPVRQGG